jgi:hypothetical protein
VTRRFFVYTRSVRAVAGRRQLCGVYAPICGLARVEYACFLAEHQLAYNLFQLGKDSCHKSIVELFRIVYALLMNILHIDSCALGDNATSRQITRRRSQP